jgi:hypothetical protein
LPHRRLDDVHAGPRSISMCNFPAGCVTANMCAVSEAGDGVGCLHGAETAGCCVLFSRVVETCFVVLCVLNVSSFNITGILGYFHRYFGHCPV